jgi:hypothetical protein
MSPIPVFLILFSNDLGHVRVKQVSLASRSIDRSTPQVTIIKLYIFIGGPNGKFNVFPSSTTRHSGPLMSDTATCAGGTLLFLRPSQTDEKVHLFNDLRISVYESEAMWPLSSGKVKSSEVSTHLPSKRAFPSLEGLFARSGDGKRPSRDIGLLPS